jgi:hypothetical protein
MLVQLASGLGSAVAVLFQVRTARSAGANGYKPEQNADDGGLQASMPDSAAESSNGSCHLASHRSWC